MFRKVGIIARKYGDEIEDTLTTLIALLRRLEIAVAVDAASAEFITDAAVEILDLDSLAADRDLVIAVGGDGTLLYAAQRLFRHDVPLAGVNLGRVGFLADVSPERLEPDLVAILNGRYKTDERVFLDCEAYRDGSLRLRTSALNDVVIQKWNTARLITFDTYIDQRLVHTQRSDGLIIATPTGSTAYALAGGGPILHPSVPALVVVPICPHTMTNRPIVVDDSVVIEVALATGRKAEAQLTCDGNEVFLLEPGDRVRVRRSDHRVRLIHPEQHDHYATLRAKLHWGMDLC